MWSSFHKKNCEVEHPLPESQFDVCSNEFVLEWRLSKHQIKHRNDTQKKRHYYNNGKNCPYDEIGCMFAHEQSDMCKVWQNL